MIGRMFSLAAWFLLVTVGPAVIAAEMPQEAESRPVELGKVRFLRSVDDGLERARKEGKPAFVLFQEVPRLQHVHRVRSRSSVGGPVRRGDRDALRTGGDLQQRRRF